jgi:hypothetical protein
MGFFWSAVPESDWPTDEESVAEIRRHIEGTYGDRRTEIVLIGKNLDQAALTARFDACLLTDEEMEQGPAGWSNLPDPFPSWLPTEPEPQAAA